MTLGERLRELRISEPYMRLREVTSALRIEPALWSRIETDRERPSISLLMAAAEVFGVDGAELLPLWESWQQAPPPDISRSICSGRRP